MEDSVAPPLGQGRYRLVEVLGAGGMAVVYKAYDARLDVARAVKVLNPAMDDHARIRFFNEARTMAKLHHRNLVTVHDVADDGDRTYLVMELVDGGSIADRMAAFGPLPPRMACEVTIALLEGLAAAHAKGIVHRDVKPHNVLVGDDSVPKVTDFGIASVADYSSTKTGAVIGTWAYMAPEQRSDSKSVDARADVFGAGCALYNMVTGVDPFDLYNQEAYEEKYAAVPEALRAPIQKATRYRADDRYASALAFAEALRALVPELPPDPPDTPPLGVTLGEKRAEIVPTLLESHLEHSSPTLSAVGRRPAPAEDLKALVTEETEKDPLPWIGAFAVLTLVFVAAGLALGVALIAGVVVFSPGSSDPAVDPEPTMAAPAPDAMQPSEPQPTEAAAPVEPEPSGSEPAVEPTEPEPVAPESVAPESAPEPAPAEPAPVAPAAPVAPKPTSTRARPEPQPEPAPEPKATGHNVRFRTVPPGVIQVNGDYLQSGDRRTYPTGTALDVTYEADGKQHTWNGYVNGPRDLCWDFTANIPCR